MKHTDKERLDFLISGGFSIGKTGEFYFVMDPQRMAIVSSIKKFPRKAIDAAINSERRGER